MEYLLLAMPSIISAVILGLVGIVSKNIKGIVSKLDASNRASKYLLKDRITHSCRHWQAEGYLPPNEAEVLQEMAREYWSLGGNSYVKEQLKITLALPMEKKE